MRWRRDEALQMLAVSNAIFAVLAFVVLGLTWAYADESLQGIFGIFPTGEGARFASARDWFAWIQQVHRPWRLASMGVPVLLLLNAVIIWRARAGSGRGDAGVPR
jgi:hypothetical protein